MQLKFALTAVVAGLALVACSNQTPTTSASDRDTAPRVSDPASRSASPPPEVDSTKAIDDYFAAFATENPDRFRRVAKASTVPGSLAAVYALHQAGSADAAIDEGSPYDPQVKSRLNNGDVSVCDSEGKSCYRYGDFKVDKAGRLASFTINKNSLAGRIIRGGGPHESSFGRVQMISAYITAAGDLSAVVKVRTHTNKIIFGQNGTTYRDPRGRQRASSDFSGPGVIQPNSQATTNLIFKGPVQLGGDINVDLTQDGGDYTTTFVQLHTK